jgi:two-component system response regulator AtoC
MGGKRRSVVDITIIPARASRGLNMDRQIVVSLVSLLETRENPTVLVDRDYRIVAANNAYCHSYGVPQDQIVGKTCHEVSHHSLRPCHMNGEQCPHQELFNTRMPCSALHTHIDFEGRPDHVRILAHPIHDVDGQMYLMESIHRLAPQFELSGDDMRMAGNSPAFLRFLEMLSNAAKTTASVWLYGESGVGKESAARFLHRHSARASKAYIDMNCAAIPENLCESELFGHEKGAFTGAVQLRRGLFELANGGTLFLDEIGDLPLTMQGKLLRVLDCGEYRRLGSEIVHKCDVRVVAATNRDLAKMVADGSFRQDLYYRIAAYKVTIPPLRERREDIPALAQIVLNGVGVGTGVAYQLAHDALDVLSAYDYPGNIRELRSIMVKAAARCRQGVIHLDDISLDNVSACGCAFGAPVLPRSDAAVPVMGFDTLLRGRRRTDRADPVPPVTLAQPVEPRDDAVQLDALESGDDKLASLEKQKISRLLAQYGNRRLVAGKLGISERTLYRKIRCYGLDRHP